MLPLWSKSSTQRDFQMTCGSLIRGHSFSYPQTQKALVLLLLEISINISFGLNKNMRITFAIIFLLMGTPFALLSAWSGYGYLTTKSPTDAVVKANCEKEVSHPSYELAQGITAEEAVLRCLEDSFKGVGMVKPIQLFGFVICGILGFVFLLISKRFLKRKESL